MPTPMPDVSCASMSPVAPIGGPLPSFAPTVSYATQECGGDIGATAPLRDMVNPAVPPLIIGRSAPSQRLIAAIIRLRITRPLTSQECADILLLQWQMQRDLPPAERRLIDPALSAIATVVADAMVPS